MQWEKSRGLSVLFVCLGNICRSPMAEGAFRAALQKAGLDAQADWAMDSVVDSAGTAGYHIGEPPDPRAIAAALNHGVDISGARGRQLSEADFETFTHIVALDTANLAGIKARAPRHHSAQISLLLDMAGGQMGQSVADPYYGDEADFEKCWAIISNAVDTLAERVTSPAT